MTTPPLQIPARLLMLALLCMGLGACAAVEDVVAPPEETPETEPGERLPTPAEPEERQEPDEPEPATRTVSGYRIQILTTAEREAADHQVAEAEQWWQSLAPSERPDYVGEEDLYVKVAWRQPYYRVRIGRFASREEAERALGAISGRFSDAFIIPDRVTVTRMW